MPVTGKVSEIFDIPAIKKEKDIVSGLISEVFDQIEKGAVASSKSQIEIADAKKFSDLTRATKEFSKTQEDLNKQTKAFEDLQKQKLKLEEEEIKIKNKLLIAASDEGKKNAELKLQLQERSKQVKEDIKLRNQAKDSISSINSEVKKLTAQYNSLSKAERESAEGTELQEKIEGMNDSLKSSDKALGDNRRNVGNYASALDGVPGPLAKISGAVKAFTAVLMANPIVLIVTAIVAAIGLLVKAFKSTDDGGTALEARFEQLKAIMEVVMDRVSRLATGIASLLSGDFSKGIKEIGSAFSGMGDQIAAATRNAWDYIHALDALNDRTTSFISQEAQLRNEIAKLKNVVEDQTKSEKDREAALIQVLAKEKEITEFKKNQAIIAFDLELEKIAARKGLTAVALRAIIEADATIVESARKTGGAVADAWNFVGDENIETLENMYAAVLMADTEFFEKSKESVTKLTTFQKMANDRRIANLKQMTAEAAALEQKLFEIRMKFGLIGVEELAERTAQAVLDSEEFKTLTVEEQENIKVQLRELSAKKASEAAIKAVEEETNAYFKWLDAQQNYLETIEKAKQDASEKTRQAEAAAQEEELNSYLTWLDRKEAAENEKRQATKEMAVELAYTLINLANSIFEAQLNTLEGKADEDEALKERELEAAGDNAAKKNEIEAKFAQKEKERAAESLKIRQKQAKFNKAVGIIDATVNTLVGVTRAFTDPGGLLGVILAAVILASGLAAVISIASQPIPSFEKGRKGGKATFAEVGEAGTEAIVSKGGDVSFTPDRSTLAYLPEGASVIPHRDLIEMAGRASMTDIPRWPGSDSSGFADLKNEMMMNRAGIMMLNETIKNKKEAHITMDKHGIRTAMADGHNWIEYINNKFRN